MGKSSSLQELASKDSIERARRKAYEEHEKELKGADGFHIYTTLTHKDGK